MTKAILIGNDSFQSAFEQFDPLSEYLNSERTFSLTELLLFQKAKHSIQNTIFLQSNVLLVGNTQLWSAR